MKKFRLLRNGPTSGFSLVEAALSLGVLSFGFLSLTPPLSLGLSSAHGSRDSRISAHIAETLEQQAQLGTLVTGTAYFDDQGTSCPSSAACYSARSTLATNAGEGTCLKVLVTPLGNPQRTQSYALVVVPL